MKSHSPDLPVIQEACLVLALRAIRVLELPVVLEDVQKREVLEDRQKVADVGLAPVVLKHVLCK